MAITKWLASIADPLQKWIAIVAVIIGGIWTYRIFVAEDTHQKNPEIDVSLEQLPYSSESRLLVVHVAIKNIGKVPIQVERDHFWIVVRKIPSNLKPGYVDLSKLTELYRTTDIANTPDEYWLEPGVRYDEVRTFVVAPATYAATAEVDYDRETGEEVDDTKLIRVE